MLEIRKLHKYYNKGKRNELHVINDTSLTFEDTGLVALLGQSGCGKTTLLNVIGGLDNARRGDIYIDGKKMTSAFQFKADTLRNLKIGYIFQDYKLIEDMSVFDNVALVLKLLGLKDQKEIQHRVDYVLEKVGMYRYRQRLAQHLSGGQRQRVGIARAIVKDPEIILADEPTGNLDSKNSLEIMKIIKSISKTKLVILVTHERELANYFASRIIEIEDGKVIKDYSNEHAGDLNYDIENRFYLKDFDIQESYENDDYHINFYKPKDSKINLDIIIKNGNIYIHSKDDSKVEVIGNDSSIELIDDHYKGYNEEVNDYEFDYNEMIHKQYKKRYSAILNPITLLKDGFDHVMSFPVIKKILLVGFVLSGFFIMYSLASISGTLFVDEKEYVTCDRNFLTVSTKTLSINEYLSYEQLEGINYMLPNNGTVEFKMPLLQYYQSSQDTIPLSGSMIKSGLLTADEIAYGRLPENDYEIVVDEWTLDSVMEGNDSLKSLGIVEYEDFLDRKVYISDMPEFTIVGISKNSTPSIYVSGAVFYNVMYYQNDYNIPTGYVGSTYQDVLRKMNSFYLDYSMATGYYTLKQGVLPSDGYSVMVPYSQRETYPLNKQIDEKINGTKLTVVGYYETDYGLSVMMTNASMIKYLAISDASSFVVYPDDRQLVIDELSEYNLRAKDVYKENKKEYTNNQMDSIKSSLEISAVIILISLIEIYLIIRSSFLSRIKEIGIYRAIGVKKMDIYKMFIGEILTITTLCSVPGILFMAYCLHTLQSYVGNLYIVTNANIVASILTVYIFNIIAGLLPVIITLMKRPAQILARYDI